MPAVVKIINRAGNGLDVGLDNYVTLLYLYSATRVITLRRADAAKEKIQWPPKNPKHLKQKLKR